ncbi:hypothetical protein [Parasphingorhabdus pacifica]
MRIRMVRRGAGWWPEVVLIRECPVAPQVADGVFEERVVLVVGVGTERERVHASGA